MASVTIELDDEVAERLQARADERGVGLPQYLAGVVRGIVDEDGPVSEEFAALTAEILETYRPVLRRLAE